MQHLSWSLWILLTNDIWWECYFQEYEGTLDGQVVFMVDSEVPLNDDHGGDDDNDYQVGGSNLAPRGLGFFLLPPSSPPSDSCTPAK